MQMILMINMPGVKAVFACPRGEYDESKQECRASMEVQSLLFDKQSWDKEHAVRWAKAHGFSADKVEESKTGKYIRIRQADPSRFHPRSFRVGELGEHEHPDPHEAEGGESNARKKEKASKKEDPPEEAEKVSKGGREAFVEKWLKKMKEDDWARELLEELERNDKAKRAFIDYLHFEIEFYLAPDELDLPIGRYVHADGTFVPLRWAKIEDVLEGWLLWEKSETLRRWKGWKK